MALFGFGALMICTVPSALLAVFAVPRVASQQWFDPCQNNQSFGHFALACSLVRQGGLLSAAIAFQTAKNVTAVASASTVAT
jgi:hypothetical protein